jgi:uncharacterized protein with GYD domain
MGHYLFRASYTTQGIQGVLQEGGSARLAVIDELVRSVGGSVSAAYWAFGGDDFLLIAELPDNTAAAALATRVSATGTASISTTVLLTAEEIDAAVAVPVQYRPPGR